jgi:hypothetical protein
MRAHNEQKIPVLNRIAVQVDLNTSGRAIPEPATLTLLGLGAAGWAARRRRHA